MQRVIEDRDRRMVNPRGGRGIGGSGGYFAVDNVEQVLNGAFASGTSWSLGAISAISGGILTATAGADGTYADSNTGTTLKAGTLYRIKYDITANNATGTFTLKIGTPNSLSATVSTTVATNKVMYFTPDITGAITLSWTLASAANAISIDNLSIMAITNP